MQALQGIKIIDLSRALSGPFCTMVLADLGADVIKVEPGPAGDMSRTWGPFDRGTSTYYLSCNRNKRGLCVDFRNPKGLDTIQQLIDDADVVIENFKPGTLESMGLGYEVLSTRNPRLILGSINAFGSDGPMSSWPGFDQIAQGYSGLMSLTGFNEGDPTRTGTAIGDLTSGMWLVSAVLAALLERERTGRGQHVNTSLLASLVGLLSVHGQRYLSLGDVPRRTGNAHAVIAPYGVFQTLDGPLNLAPITSAMWGRLCVLLDLPELPDDPRFASNEARVERRDELKAILETRLKTRGKRDWTERFIAAGLPAGPINTLDEVFADPQVLHSQLTRTLNHPNLGALRQVVTPIFSDAAPTELQRPPPLLGEHSVEILQQAGFDPASIQALLNSHVILQATHPEHATGVAP
ncbi:CoA transferase [Pseudomonas sp. TH34]|jgi:formyl-CoA transferase|uniref:CoA transferase n=1 Tax=Pseudomonas yamanorum TaxID=515393 RepID=A0AAJ3H9L6_9PSED|nr:MULTISPECIES: CaiB/BaiF CoA-transferase family protein [Pseudomonas]AMW82999.1 L-carnitine dehydratase/bile acid-inducible protein F [Pseudomonas yamanorum]MBK5411700.1 CoA transferase [Pseudomonas sp. TH34]MBV6663766.1 CoA transferase [Pseudomonas yamanorum]NWD45074.1 CoA transferase [Pseudomonas yamanorum]WVN19517.1 CaiB/BaiF CoA-transferase family protein [Pseudomonas yamanorum]